MYNYSLSRMVPLPSTSAGCSRMASTLLVAQLLLAVGLAQLDRSSPQQPLPRLDTATEKGLSVCTRVLKGATIPDDQAWYTYFSCVEKELFKHKVISYHGLHPLNRERRSAFNLAGASSDTELMQSLLKDPKAVKMVLEYLTKQKLEEHRHSWKQLAKSTTTTTTTTTTTRRTTTTKKPPRRTTTSIDRVDKGGGGGGKKKKPPRKKGSSGGLGSLFKLLLSPGVLGPGPQQSPPLRSGNGPQLPQPPPQEYGRRPGPPQPPSQGPPPRRRDPSPWSSFFRQPTPPAAAERVNNPLVTGEQEPDLQFFGPSDFVPKHRYQVPMKEHGPGRLRYMSAKEFPNVQRYGLIPIPRR